jgi:GntR family transcriptional repressor for pyruvate dehydrogenase complex
MKAGLAPSQVEGPRSDVGGSSMRTGPAEQPTGKAPEGSTEQVIAHVRNLIVTGALKPGDRLPAERELAVEIGVSRPTVRAGLRALSAMGVVQARHGSGTYIPSGPPMLGSEPDRKSVV